MLRRRVAVFTALAAFAALAGGASSPDKGLFFEESGQVVAKWDQLRGKGVRVVVCNAGGRKVPRLHARLVGLGLERGGEPVAVRKVLKVVKQPARLGASRCAKVILKAATVVAPDAKEFEGELLLVSAGAGGIRRSLKIVGPGFKPPAEIKPVRPTTSFTATGGPFGIDAKLDGNELALVADIKSGAIQRLSKGRVLGQVFKDGDASVVKVDGDPKDAGNGQVLLPIKVEGIDHPGTYNGKLDLTGDTAEKDRVAITVRATDWVGFALIAIGLGVLAALFPVAVRRRNVLSDLERVRDGLRASYAAAVKRLHEAPAGKKFCGPDLTSFIADFDRALSRYRKGTVGIKRTDKTYLHLRSTLRDAEEDAAVMGAELGPALDKLHGCLLELEEFLDGDDWADEPVFRDRAWRLLAGGELPVGGSIELRDKADGYAALTGEWLRLARLVSKLEADAAGLIAGIGAMTDFDQQLLASSRSQAAEAGDRLRAIAKPGEIDAAVEASVHAVDGSVTYLRERYPETSEHFNARAAFRALRRERSPDRSGDEIRGAGPLPKLPEVAVKLVQRGLRMVLDLGVIALAVSTAVVASLSAFYFGETWGTTEDYLTVILIGTGAQVVVKAITDAVEQRAADTDDSEPVADTA